MSVVIVARDAPDLQGRDPRERRWGRIVNMSSIGGIYPNPKLLVSHVLSAAIGREGRELALDLAQGGQLSIFRYCPRSVDDLG